MSNPWFRLYSEIIDDEKIRLLAFEDRWHYVAILCLKNTGFLDKQHKGDLLRRGMSVKLGVNGVDLDNLKNRLIEVDLIDSNWQPTGWDSRQFQSDASKDRVRKYREKRASAGMTKSTGGYLKYWGELIGRDGACVYCGSVENLCVDHMVPVSQGGLDDIENLCVACKQCNSGKAGRTPEQAGYEIRNPITKECLERYRARVTVTVTVQDTDTDTDTEEDTEKKRKVANAPGVVYPIWLNMDLWREFLATRRTGKTKFTAHAEKLALSKLLTLCPRGDGHESVINQTIESGWKTFFPLRADQKPKGSMYDNIRELTQ